MPVYLVRSGDAVKIGRTKDHLILARLGQLQSSNPVKLVLLRVLDGGEEVEAQLHARFKHLRIHFEWFHYTPEMDGDLGFSLSSLDAQLERPWPVLGKTSEKLIKQRIAKASETRRSGKGFRIEKRPPPADRAKQRDQWAALRAEGHTFKAIAKAAGLSRQRIHQFLHQRAAA